MAYVLPLLITGSRCLDLEGEFYTQSTLVGIVRRLDSSGVVHARAFLVPRSLPWCGVHG